MSQMYKSRQRVVGDALFARGVPSFVKVYYNVL